MDLVLLEQPMRQGPHERARVLPAASIRAMRLRSGVRTPAIHRRSRVGMQRAMKSP